MWHDVAGCQLNIALLNPALEHALGRTLVLLHVAYSEEPFVAESERLKWSTVDRGLGRKWNGTTFSWHHSRVTSWNHNQT